MLGETGDLLGEASFDVWRIKDNILFWCMKDNILWTGDIYLPKESFRGGTGRILLLNHQKNRLGVNQSGYQFGYQSGYINQKNQNSPKRFRGTHKERIVSGGTLWVFYLMGVSKIHQKNCFGEHFTSFYLILLNGILLNGGTHIVSGRD